MNITRSSVHFLLVCVGGWIMLAPLGKASTVVWEDDFTGRSDYTGYSYYAPSGNDYNLTVTGTPNTHTTSVTDGVLAVSDGGGDYASLTVNSSRWAPFSMAAGDTITFAADINVSSFIHGSNNAAVPRLVITAGGVTAFTLGFGRGAANDGGDADTDMFFYSPADGLPTTGPSGSSAIGLIEGSGWELGFNFGEYNASNGSSNGTNGFYRLEATFTQGSTSITASLTELDVNGEATANSVAFGITMASAANFSSGTHSLYYTSGSGSVTTTHLDNLSVTVNNIPEPSRAMLVFMACLFAGFRRRRQP